MLAVFYISGSIAVLATLLMVTQLKAVNALLYLVVSLLGVAVVFFTLGAPFVAALEIVIYAGAIMVLFVFVVMMLNLGERSSQAERQLLAPRAWPGPAALAAVLLIEVVYLLSQGGGQLVAGGTTPKQVAMSLFGPYAIGVELASLLLLAALVGAVHLGTRQPASPPAGGAS